VTLKRSYLAPPARNRDDARARMPVVFRTRGSSKLGDMEKNTTRRKNGRVEQWTISEEEAVRRAAFAQAAAENASKPAKTRESWGLFAYGDAPPAISGGVGGFLWFPSRSRLFDFVGEHLTFIAPGRSDIDPGRVAAETKVIARRMATQSVGLPAGIRLLNRTLRHFSQVEWIGTLEELLGENGRFPRKVRSWIGSVLYDAQPPRFSVKTEPNSSKRSQSTASSTARRSRHQGEPFDVGVGPVS
jgi:hypothetical protein